MGEHGGAGSEEAGGATSAFGNTGRRLELVTERFARQSGDTSSGLEGVATDVSCFPRHDIEDLAYPCYPAAEALDPHVGRSEAERRLTVAGEAVDEPFELSLHLPFQGGRPLHGARAADTSLAAAGSASYLDFARREAERVGLRLRDRRRVSRLRIGGTPAFYAPRELQSFVADLFARFPPFHSAELGIEMDPRVTTEAHLEVFAAFGFDCAWIGVEDFAASASVSGVPPPDVELAARALERTRRAGFGILEVDLVLGLAHHSHDSVDAAAGTAVALGFDRITLRQAVPTSGAALVSELETAARHRLIGAGYQPIGLDHFVRSGDALTMARRTGRLRRSSGRYTAACAGDRIGLGVGATSEVAGACFQNARRLDHYETALADWSLPTERGMVLDRDDEVRRHVIHDLLCHGRIDAREIEADLGVPFADYFADELASLRPSVTRGRVSLSARGVEVLAAGRPFGRELAEAFDRRRLEPRRDGSTLAFRRRV